MPNKEKIDEIERLLKELKASEAETAVTVEEIKERSPHVRRVGTPSFSLLKRPSLLLLSLLLIVAIAVSIVTVYKIKNASTFTESKTAVVERIQNLNELTTAKVNVKAIVQREDNKAFGKDIPLNLPGTKRKILVIIPGSIKVGIDLSQLTEKDVTMDHDEKTATLTLPPADFLGGAELYFEEVETFSYEGLLRGKADLDEAYELADEAKALIKKEAAEQGVLLTAEENAVKALTEMFSFGGYEVTVEFKE